MRHHGAGEEGSVRLVNVIEVNGFVTGALQILCDGVCGAVCRSYFDNADAQVACRQLGFSTGVAFTEFSRFGTITPDEVWR